MDILAELLEALLVLHAEMLLLIDDEEAEIGELHPLGKKRVRADDDIDIAGGETLLHFGAPLGADQARGLGDLHREAAEALAEGVEVLTGEERRRHHDRNLLAGKNGDEARAERNLGLAETDIAAHEPIHGTPAGEILEHGADARLLVVGLFVRKSRRELVIDPVGRSQHRGAMERAERRDLDQLFGYVADPLLEGRFPRLPRNT